MTASRCTASGPSGSTCACPWRDLRLLSEEAADAAHADRRLLQDLALVAQRVKRVGEHAHIVDEHERRADGHLPLGVEPGAQGQPQAVAQRRRESWSARSRAPAPSSRPRALLVSVRI